MKSPLFRHVVGTAAFHVFDWRGEMRHALNEEILGDSVMPVDSLDKAMLRLKSSIYAFQSWHAPMHPHFAYGALSKHQYEKANSMHIANHFSEIEY